MTEDLSKKVEELEARLRKLEPTLFDTLAVGIYKANVGPQNTGFSGLVVKVDSKTLMVVNSAFKRPALIDSVLMTQLNEGRFNPLVKAESEVSMGTSFLVSSTQ